MFRRNGEQAPRLPPTHPVALDILNEVLSSSPATVPTHPSALTKAEKLRLLGCPPHYICYAPFTDPANGGHSMHSQTVRSLVIPLLATFLAATVPGAPPLKLNVTVVEGEGAINNIKRRTSRETIVQVEDENHKPVAGAAVAFLLPADGPGGAFTGGTKSASVVTDNAGRAAMPHLQVNSNPGSYSIGVYASQAGLASSATISQSSIVGAAAAVSTAGIIGIVAGVAAAGGVALAVVSKGKSNNSSPSQPAATPTGSVAGGSGTVFGPPH